MFQIRYKISRQLFLLLALFAAVPISLLSFFCYNQAKNALTRTAFMHMATISEDHGRHVETWFKERSNDLNMLSQIPTVRDICERYCSAGEQGLPSTEHPELLKEILTLFQKSSPFYESLHILSPSGKILASTKNPSDIIHGFKRKLLRSKFAAKKKVFVFDLHRHKNQDLYLHMAAKIKTNMGKAVGFILADVDIKKTLEPVMTDRNGLGKTGETYVVAKDKTPITRLRFLNHSYAKSDLIDSYGLEEALRHKKGTAIYKNYAGKVVVGSYLWLPEQRWAIISEIHKDEIMRPLKMIKLSTIYITFCTLLFCFLVSFYISHKISSPIKEMTQAAENIARGEFGHQVSYPRANEIGQLAEAFNSMSEQLSRTISNLKEKEKAIRMAYDDLAHTQEKLVQSEKLAAIGEFIASIVHEMRNPLSSIKLNLQIIGRDLEQTGRPFEHYQIAFGQVKQLEKMFSDLLNYSKPIALEAVPVNIQDLITLSLSQIEGELTKKKINVHKRIPEDLPSILVDHDKIVQVFVNVFKNAIEALQTGGVIEISADVIKSAPKSMVTVIISDNGPGLTDSQLDRVYQPFFTTKKYGTGLGLSVVKKILDAHQGRISISSSQKKGTRVMVSFPIA